MKHEYTDTQLRQAVAYFLEDEEADLSVSTLGEFFWTQQVKALRKMLDALPEPAQQHPEIEFDDVRKGDRIDVLTIHGNREILTVEARTDVHLLAMGTQIQATNYVQSIRLISRPAQHPDPAEHPAIVVVEADYFKGQDPQVLVWTGRKYENDGWAFEEDDITEWHPIDPAKVVADNA